MKASQGIKGIKVTDGVKVTLETYFVPEIGEVQALNMEHLVIQVEAMKQKKPKGKKLEEDNGNS